MIGLGLGLASRQQSAGVAFDPATLGASLIAWYRLRRPRRADYPSPATRPVRVLRRGPARPACCVQRIGISNALFSPRHRELPQLAAARASGGGLPCGRGLGDGQPAPR